MADDQYKVSADEGPSKYFLSSLRTFDPPPKDFDPLKEKNSVLVKHGYPARPSADAPLLRAAWEEAFSKNPTFITPTFSLLPPVQVTPASDVHLLNVGDSSLCGAFLAIFPPPEKESEWLW